MPSAKRSPALATAAAALLALAGCIAGNYAHYRSPFGDFVCEVPKGWTTIVDSGGPDFYQITFAGPLQPEFYKGVPSLSVRWYRLNTTHRLPDGSYELYASVRDYMDQMLHDIYGPDGYYKGGDDVDQERAAARNQALGEFETIKMSGDRDALFFVAYHNVPAPVGANYGVVSDDEGHRIIRERHGYAILPVRDGFYVLVYPATRNGFERFKKSFLRMVLSFRLLREGPQ